MPATDHDLTSLANSHDIISIGMLADDLRRTLHGTRTTFVRVATASAEAGAPVARASAAGELRIVGAPASLSAAVARTGEAAAAAGDAVVTGFSLQDLERLSVQEGVTLRALLEELRAAGLELVGDAAVDALQDARRSIEEVNIAGLALARLTVDRAESPDGRVDFQQPDIALAVKHLPIEVREIHALVVDQPDPSHACGCEVERRRCSKPTDADDRNRRTRQTLLACRPDLVQDALAMMAHVDHGATPTKAP